MTTSPFSDDDDNVQDLDEALQDFVGAYRLSMASSIGAFLDDWLDDETKRDELETKTLEIFEPAGDRIAATLKKGLQD